MVRKNRVPSCRRAVCWVFRYSPSQLRYTMLLAFVFSILFVFIFWGFILFFLEFFLIVTETYFSRISSFNVFYFISFCRLLGILHLQKEIEIYTFLPRSHTTYFLFSCLINLSTTVNIFLFYTFAFCVCPTV